MLCKLSTSCTYALGNLQRRASLSSMFAAMFGDCSSRHSSIARLQHPAVRPIEPSEISLLNSPHTTKAHHRYPQVQILSTAHASQMCLYNPVKQHMVSRRNATTTRREAKMEKTDNQRLNENLLKIALKRRTSTNSLTDRNPTKVVTEKKSAWEEEMAKK